MRFEWHEPKNRLNWRKHRVRFEVARQVFADPFALMLLDETVDGEERWRAIGRAGADAVLVVAHIVKRAGVEERIRILSARPALSHERRQYEKQAR